MSDKGSILATGYWLLATGYWLLATGYRLPATGYRLLVYTILAVITFSCANPLSPTGGPKDTTPPVVEEAVPLNFSTEFSGNNIQLDFNEYVQLNSPNEQIIISPPFQETPEYRLRSKTLVIKFNEVFKENTTYSISFGNAVADITENNPLDNYKYVFSSGITIDSMILSGQVVDAFDVAPAEDVWIMLYIEDKDSIPYLERPYYISKADKEGHFKFYNLKNVPFKIFALRDANSNYLYDLPNEWIAFSDSLVNPVYPVHLNDSTSGDSLIGILPESIRLHLFEEIDSIQQLTEYKLVKANHINFIFRFPTIDLQVVPIDFSLQKTWMSKEFTSMKDTMIIWIMEPVPDTLTLEIIDNGLVLDTVEIVTKPPEPVRRKARSSPKNKNIKLTSPVLKSKMQVPFKPLILTSPYPIQSYDFSGVIMIEDHDTLLPEVSFDNELQRRIVVDHKWKEDINYQLIIPDSSLTDILGNHNDSIVVSFKTKSYSDYGQLILDLTITEELPHQIIIQLLNENDMVINEGLISDGIPISYNYLLPGKYKIKVIFDRNNNGRWDTGNYIEKKQPENVLFFNKLIEIRPNWVSEESMEI
ncbi:MAG: Ig-like domain-containing protein [Bacteroidales bacterium]|nr:Ig-like domain-containing protein [Bacteroidales bacterium]